MNNPCPPPLLFIFCSLIVITDIDVYFDWEEGEGHTGCPSGYKVLLSTEDSTFKALSHPADLARRSYTEAQICWFSGIGTSTAAQRYHIAKNGSTSWGHPQNIGNKISNGMRQ